MKKLTKEQRLFLLQLSLSVTSACAIGAAWGTAVSLNGNGVWGSAGDYTDDGTVAHAAANAALNFTGNGTLTLNNDGTARDAGATGTNFFSVGAITQGGGVTGNVTVTNSTAANMTATIASLAISGGAVAVTNMLTANTLAATISGAVTTGSFGVTAGSGSAATSTATLNGSTISASGFTLNDGTGSSAKLKFSGGTAQSITGAINGSSSGKGTVEVSGVNTVATFNTRIGQTTIAALNVGAGATANLSYNSHLSATTVTLTDSGNDLSTLNFGQTLTGGNKSTDATINGAGAGQGTINITSGGAYHIYGTVGATNALRAFNVTAGANNAQAIIENTDFNALSTTLTDSTGSASLSLINGSLTRAVSGTIDGAGSNQGTLIIGDKTVNLTNTTGIGQTYSLKLMTADNSSTTNIAGGFNVTDTTLASTAILNFSGNGKTVTGTISGNASNRGAVNVTGTGNITFVGNIGSTLLNSFSVASGGAATFSTGTVLAATTVTNAGTATLGSVTALTAPTLTNTGTLVVSNPTTLTSTTAVSNSGTLTLNSKLTTSGNTTTFNLASATASTINMGAASYTGDTMIDASTVTTVAATNTVTVVPDSSFLSGSVAVVKAGTTAPDASKFTATGTNLIDYVFTNPSVSTVTLTARAKSTSSLVSSLGITSAQATVVEPLLTVAQGNSTLTTAISNAMITSAGAASVAVQTAPDTSGAVGSTLTQQSSVASNTLSGRMNESRGGSSSSNKMSQIQSAGLSAGNDPHRSSIWVKPYAYLGDQKEIDGVAGYKNKTYGSLLGIDRLFTDKLRLGISGGYSNANIHGGGLSRNDTDVTSFQTALYGDYATDTYFIGGLAGFGLSELNTTRRITFGGLNQVALGEYHAEQFFARLEGGRPFTFAESHTLTPTIGFDYSYLKSDPYTETGADALNLSLTPDSVSTGLTTLGASYRYTHQLHQATIQHTLRAGVGYDVLKDDGIATVKFASGTNSFRSTAPDISPIEAHVGAGLGYASADEITQVTLDYDAEMREKYLGHTIRLEWRYSF